MDADVDTDDEANNIGTIFQNLMSESFRVSWWCCFCSWNFFDRGGGFHSIFKISIFLFNAGLQDFHSYLGI